MVASLLFELLLFLATAVSTGLGLFPLLLSEHPDLLELLLAAVALALLPVELDRGLRAMKERACGRGWIDTTLASLLPAIGILCWRRVHYGHWL